MIINDISIITNTFIHAAKYNSPYQLKLILDESITDLSQKFDISGLKKNDNMPCLKNLERNIMTSFELSVALVVSNLESYINNAIGEKEKGAITIFRVLWNHEKFDVNNLRHTSRGKVRLLCGNDKNERKYLEPYLCSNYSI